MNLFFIAAVSTYLVTEEGHAVIIKTLPAYIARREAERAIDIEAAKKGTLGEAFKLLKESLDPPVNVYDKTRKYYDMLGPRVSSWTITLSAWGERQGTPKILLAKHV